MEPFDVKTKEEWETLLNGLSNKVKMAASLTDKDGNIILTKGNRYPLCAKIRENKGSLTFICSQTNRAMLVEVMGTMRPVVDLCEAGLCRMVVPIIAQGKMAGMVTACGVAIEGEEIDEFLIAKQAELSEDEVAELARLTPICKEEDIERVANHLFKEIND